MLRDPWNTPYKVETSDEGTRERVGFRSAGPDKQFGTGDDLELDVAQRNLFSIPGEQLSKLLTHAAKTSRALPANLDQLKALAAEEGLDLDSDSAGTRAPDSKPYKYEIDIHRCFYSVRVYRANDEEVWSSPYIDYFSSTEARMESALQAWTGAGKAFPATEAEARQAFSAAGIDFDALRDPLGRSFQLRATQLLVYTMNEQVKAGGELHVQSKPVTQLMRAVQILRSPDAAQGESAETADLVTQFLHPLSEQSGSDMKPQPADHGTFKGNSGAIGGTVTDQTGAVVARAVVTVKDASGTETMGTTEANGMYLVNGLAPGIYRLNVRARGFEDFSVYEIRVSAASLTTVDITLRVGAETETVTVAADAMPMMATASAQVSVSRGVLGPGKKTLVSGPGGRAEISEPTFTPRLRHVFDETAYWAPSLETNANGSTRLSFHLPDSLTTWNLRALASTSDGRAGALDETFKTFQPFFIDLDAPQALTQGDEIVLPVNLRNYTAQSLALPITVKAADWLQPLTPLSQRITVPAGATAPVHFGFRAAGTVDEGPLRITAANGREGDAVEKIVRVHPDGRPESVTASGLLRGTSTTLSVDLPAGLIPGSIHAQLLLFPSIGAQLVHSIQASLERPYGCAEQTISSAYPSLLFLEMLKASKSNSALETKAQTYLQLGADRLRDYFDASGGLTYWGGSDHAPDPALTAYGIEFLMEAGPFVHVDPDRVTRAARWLMAAQKEDGSWAPRYGEPNAELTLYVARMLERVASDSEYGSSKDLKDGLQAAIARALDRADHSASAVHDVYANAIRLEIAIARSDAPSIQRLHDELVSTAVRDREGAHWPRDGYSPFYGWGRAGAIEAAAVAYSALEDRSSETDGRLLNDVLFFLLRSRDNYGIWYSGQATVRVLKALLPVAVRQIAAPAGAAGFNLAVNGAPIDAASASQLRADTQLIDAPRSLDLTALLRPGHNELVFSGTNEAALASAEVSASFYTPWSTEDETKTAQTTTGRDYGLDFGYRCDLTDAKVGKPIGCSVTARRFGSQSYGMLLAEVGLPPGADVDRASLGKLLDNWTISRYELQPDRIVFYLWSWSAEGSHFSFRFTPRYAIRAKAAPSALTDYYNPDLQAVLAPQLFDVK
ncbi:MAG: alpha-2-macroglobulin family protein [Terracidiphilus sp.]